MVQSSQSHVTTDGQSLSMSWCLVQVALDGLHPNEFQKECIKATFFMSPLGGLHVKHALQCGIWVPSQHLLWGQGKPRKSLI
jgi:hypothetical protein